MDGRGGKPEFTGRLTHAHQFAGEGLGGGRAPGNVPVTAQIADQVLCEAQAARRGALLLVEDARDGGVVVVLGQTPYQADRVFVGAHRGRARARQAHVELGERAAAPAQLHQGAVLLAVHADADLLEQRAQQLLLVARRCRGGLPHARQVVAQAEKAAAFIVGQRMRALLLALRKFGLRLLKGAQTLFPVRFEPARDQTVVRVHRAIAALGLVGLVLRTLHRQAPLGKGPIVVGLQLLGRAHSGAQSRGGNGGEERLGHGLVDLHAADVQAVHAAAVDHALVGAVVPRRLLLAPVVRAQLASAMATRGQALQQRCAFSQRTSRLVGLRSRVRAQALLVGFERGPVDIAFVMTGDEHGPLAARQHADALANDALFIDELLGARLAEGVGASIDGIAQHGVDRSVGGGEPAHRCARMRLQRKRQPFVAKP